MNIFEKCGHPRSGKNIKVKIVHERPTEICRRCYNFRQNLRRYPESRREHDSQYFRCGHEKTGENTMKLRTGYTKCLICPQKRKRHKRMGPGSVVYFEKRMKSQKGLCDICLRLMTRPQQDHNNGCCPRIADDRGRLRLYHCCGKCLRSLLCTSCNTKLGLVETVLLCNPILKGDSSEWLIKAHKYVWEWERIHSRLEVVA